LSFVAEEELLAATLFGQKSGQKQYPRRRSRQQGTRYGGAFLCSEAERTGTGIEPT
jgi:hypothetical protein